MRASRSVVQYLCHNSRRQISGSKLLLHLALCIDEDSPPRSGHLRPSSSSQDQQTHEFREDRETHVCQAAPMAEESDKASQSSGKVNLSSACPWSRRLHSRVDRDKQRLQTKTSLQRPGSRFGNRPSLRTTMLMRTLRHVTGDWRKRRLKLDTRQMACPQRGAARTCRRA